MAENTLLVADPESLSSGVKKLVADFPLRDHSHPKELKKLAEYIKQQLMASEPKSILATFDIEVELVPFKVGEHEYYNVVAKLGPPTKQRIVIGAHYDTAGPFPGADDNASGVIGLIEIAKLLAHLNLRNRIELVAYSLEEPPYFATSEMGSAVHARSLKAEGAEVFAMISLEMIGYFSDKPNSQEFPSEELRAVYPSVGNFISVVGRVGEESLTNCVSNAMKEQVGLPVYHVNGPLEMKGIGFSDHLSYWRNGFPAVMVTDTAFFRNKNYHTENDLPETLDYQRMGKVIQGVFKAVWAIDGGCKSVSQPLKSPN